jgi:magnesium chelatase family protein
MVQRVATVAFEGIEARAVDVQVQVAPGLPAFLVVGLPDKSVTEARQRVRSALIASGLALPARRVTVNLAPADLPKEGSHYDLPIALGLMAAIGAIPSDALPASRCWVSWVSTARSRRWPACFPPRSAPMCARKA